LKELIIVGFHHDLMEMIVIIMNMAEKKREKCEECYRYIDGEHIVVPIRDISFFTLNLNSAFMLLDGDGKIDQIKISEEEKKIMKRLWDRYAPIVHYWSSGQFYDMPEKEHKNFKYKHESYM